MLIGTLQASRRRAGAPSGSGRIETNRRWPVGRDRERFDRRRSGVPGASIRRLPSSCRARVRSPARPGGLSPWRSRSRARPGVDEPGIQRLRPSWSRCWNPMAAASIATISAPPSSATTRRRFAFPMSTKEIQRPSGRELGHGHRPGHDDAALPAVGRIFHTPLLRRIRRGIDDPRAVGCHGRILRVDAVGGELARAAAVACGDPDLEVAAAIRAPEKRACRRGCRRDPSRRRRRRQPAHGAGRRARAPRCRGCRRGRS